MKIKEYLVFINFLKKSSSGSTDLSVLRSMIRKFSYILQTCSYLRIKVFKRLFSKSHNFDGCIQKFISNHQEILKNDKIMLRQDLI